MVEVHRHDLGDPDAGYSMLLSHILGAHGIGWHSNIVVTSKNSSVQACLAKFRELNRNQLQQMKDAIIAEFKQIKDPDKELLAMDSKRMESLTDDCLCLAVASYVLDPEHYPLIPYTVGSGIFMVESPIKKRPEELRVVSPVP